MPSPLQTLAQYLAGIFENREQAIAEPIWYVSLRLWQYPVQVFAADSTGDSVTLFAEQANVINADQPYRQRLIRVMRSPAQPDSLQVQYYGFKQPAAFKGAGQQPQLLAALTADQVQELPGCVLLVSWRSHPRGTHFVATPPTDACCQFSYDGKIGQVSLGLEINPDEFLTYDKGIDPNTGKALWGALMGPYRYRKVENFAIAPP
ncbi:MAG: chromophore lyase CpcT/CpeT [Leptolyngbyaceae cyanobacterium bins.349]|nr:chromophore lyase CpcT/CpeT [Leptolyngbyaceae cyanobacterium bins.349]